MMAVYRVSGVDKVSGAERTLVVEAENEREAAAKASDEGIYTSRIELQPDPLATGSKPSLPRSPSERQAFFDSKVEEARMRRAQEVADRGRLARAPAVRLHLNTDSIVKLGVAIGIGIALGTLFTLIMWFLLGAYIVSVGHLMRS